VTEGRPTPLLPADKLRPSRLSGSLRRRAARGGVDASGVTFLAGSPKPQIKNEGGAMHLGRVTVASGVRLWAHKGGRLAVGDDTVLDEGVEIISWASVTIGRRCYLGWDVLIMDTDLHTVGDAPLDNRPVVIGDNVRIGCRCMVLKGVTIGDGAVIHPGAIVTRDVPAGAEVRPVEARLLKRIETT